jgi:pimeloyl-ACP methyl ester carboxylesterase
MNYWEKVIYIKRVVDHFKLEKCSIIGHSMGGSTGFLIASLYPDLVDRLLTLDIIKPVSVPLAWHTQDITEAIDLHLEMERKSQDPKNQKSFTQEQLVNRYVEAMGGTIYPEAVRVLMKRGSKASGSGFVFSHDPRMVKQHFP